MLLDSEFDQTKSFFLAKQALCDFLLGRKLLMLDTFLQLQLARKTYFTLIAKSIFLSTLHITIKAGKI